MGNEYDNEYADNQGKRKKKKKKHSGQMNKKVETNDADVENLYSADPSNYYKI